MEIHGFVGWMQGLNLALKLTVTLGIVKYAFNAKHKQNCIGAGGDKLKILRGEHSKTGAQQTNPVLSAVEQNCMHITLHR